MLWTLFFALLGTAHAAPTWSQLTSNSSWSLFNEKATKNAGTVKLYNATIGGTACFKAQAEVSGVSTQALLGVATDIEGAMSWSSAGIKDAATLKKSGTTLDYYQYLEVPLISDRFWFLHGTLVNEGSRVGLRWEKAWEGGGPYASTWQAVKDAHPGAVEPPVNVGGWLFEPVATAVSATYLVCTDAGGSIPANLQSMATKGTLPTTVDDLVKEARRRGN